MFAIFDYDGVIIDSVPEVSQFVVEFYRYLGVENDDGITEVHKWLGPSLAASVARVRSKYGIAESRQHELVNMSSLTMP